MESLGASAEAIGWPHQENEAEVVCQKFLGEQQI